MAAQSQDRAPRPNARLFVSTCLQWYTDSGRTIVWGNTVGTDTVSATGNGASQSYTVFGRVPAQTTPAPATYTDTITVTVTY
jgi:spore coat protein U-like protein